MRIQSKEERIQKIVTLSEINLYHLDKELQVLNRFVLYSDRKVLTEEGEIQIRNMIGKEGFLVPVIWESAAGELVGLIQDGPNSYYVTEVVEGDKLVKLLTYLELAYNILFDKDIFQKDILLRHKVDVDEIESRVQDIIETDKTQAIYHSFNDEHEFTTAIENGDKDKVHEFLEMGYVQTFRRTSSDMMTHYRNVCISSITLASRAAIRGGVPASMAYDFSNTMMKQVDKIPTVSQMYGWICSVFNRYTQMVLDAKKNELNNNLVEQIRQYVLAHYKEKITVQNIADYIGRSPNYISSIYKEKTGENLVHYINREKISAAKNILKYSEMDVSTVSNFLAFSSQAYFGKVFKEITGMTPKTYKDQNRVKELSFETAIKK